VSMDSYSFNFENFSGEVRLFPLPNYVLFPWSLAPLHIFESRYREMFEDAISDDHLITMATLLPGFEHEYYGRAPIAPVVCIGRVTEHERTVAGTYNLMLLGLKRAKVLSEIEPVRSFRRAHVQLLEDTNSPSVDISNNLGRELAARLEQIGPTFAKLVEQFFEGRITLACVLDVLAFNLPLPVDVKLELLGELDILARANRLLSFLPQAERRLHRPGFKGDFSEN